MARVTHRYQLRQRWGNPGYAALDVLLDDGGGHLFWCHELEEVDDS
ncbi:MAG: hypothetical protein K0S88_6080, partial [Actinomycetia bacterium]|nr:hypothetical protein [Actinomycetes bacterium]